jgi:predicted HTH transcriptional regulator
VRVEALQQEADFNLCCRIHFERTKSSEIFGMSERFNQEFKDYRWPLENESIRFHLTKTVVGFLNTNGGIIYVGLKEDKNKFVEVKGIELSKKQKEDFLYFMHDKITVEVFPKS